MCTNHAHAILISVKVLLVTWCVINLIINGNNSTAVFSDFPASRGLIVVGTILFCYQLLQFMVFNYNGIDYTLG